MNKSAIQHRLEQIRDLSDRGFAYFDFEQMLQYHYRHWVKPGDRVIDIGAHTGLHLGPLLDAVGLEGEVIAFEPLPFAFDILRESYQHPNVTIHNVALSKAEGESDFTFAQGTPQESGLKERNYNCPSIANPTTIKVQTKLLDSYTRDLDNLSFVKIDIEGAEVDCLNGARDTLTRLRPVISVEYGSPSFSVYGHSADSLYMLAEKHQYALFDIFLNQISDLEDWRRVVDFISWDFFMVPEEKLEQFRHRLLERDLERFPDPRTAITQLHGTIAQLQKAVGELNSKLEIQAALIHEVPKPIRHLFSFMGLRK